MLTSRFWLFSSEFRQNNVTVYFLEVRYHFLRVGRGGVNCTADRRNFCSLNKIFCLFIYLFIIGERETEREHCDWGRGAEGENNLSRLHAQHRAPDGAQLHRLTLESWRELKSGIRISTIWATEVAHWIKNFGITAWMDLWDSFHRKNSCLFHWCILCLIQGPWLYWFFQIICFLIVIKRTNDKVHILHSWC